MSKMTADKAREISNSYSVMNTLFESFDQIIQEEAASGKNKAIREYDNNNYDNNNSALPDNWENILAESLRARGFEVKVRYSKMLGNSIQIEVKW